MPRHTVSVHRFFFCVGDAKINCDLENEQQQEGKKKPLTTLCRQWKHSVLL